MTERYELAAPEVIADLIDGEAVAIDLTSGHYHRLQGPAAEVWASLLEGASAEEIISAAQPEIGPADVTSFIAALLAEGLLRARTAPGHGPTRAWAAGPLVLETFDDLEDILGIDPIHEVDPDRGWPNLPGA